MRGGIPFTPEQYAAQFWAKVNKNGPVQPHCPELGPCWEWTAALNNGYGSYGQSNKGREKLTHRISWVFVHGPISSETCVLHKCDNRRCVRPDHLWTGDRNDNNMDAIAKGRVIHPPATENGVYKYPEAVLKGSKNGSSKLTEADIPIIREMIANGMTNVAIAKQFPVSNVVIGHIRHRRFWTHVP